jgi:hypothetical protein
VRKRIDARVDAFMAAFIEVFDILTAMTATGPRKSARATSLVETRHEREQTVVLLAKPDLDAPESEVEHVPLANIIVYPASLRAPFSRGDKIGSRAGRRRERRQG